MPPEPRRQAKATLGGGPETPLAVASAKRRSSERSAADHGREEESGAGAEPDNTRARSAGKLSGEAAGAAATSD